MARMIGNTLGQQLEQALRHFSLTHAQLAALAQLGLAHPEPLTGTRLAHRAGVTPQAMSNAVSDLQDRGLVARQANPNHGRVLDVTITGDGRDLLDRAQVAAKSVEDRAMSALTPAQEHQLKELLRTVMVTLDLYLPDTGHNR
ncbi:MarR family winged helix-turn-helix transcriptional regulator [Streptomonospora wellingtoniae]|uniref:MarR family transcriptional regulator n=1 Tax=Streptomonospora wellingtoniae TaxID=3075544 RepID=A0ABU2KNI6_9ACTN|nr:MarR family transcriptional regulator [Streptomonospora sp. DSM 45055]MDT0300827.1 MarR family transcriptional regulator [Streptomonospora sp. DSM 45055]